MVQVYLATGNPELRLRSAGGKVTLGAKSGQGLVREEAEALVDTASAAPLLAILAGSGSFPVVRKTRYKTAESPWEVDVYTARSHCGLVVAEIELSAEDEPLPPLPPGLALGREITGEAAWANQSLALFEGNALTPEQKKTQRCRPGHGPGRAAPHPLAARLAEIQSLDPPPAEQSADRDMRHHTSKFEGGGCPAPVAAHAAQGYGELRQAVGSSQNVGCLYRKGLPRQP